MIKRSVLVLILSITFFSCGERERTPEFFETSFEGDKPFSEWENDQHCCEYSVTQSNEVFIDGDHSVRFEIRKTDPSTSRAIRAELVKGENHPGDESWYGFNLFLQDWVDDNAGEHVFQWHPRNSSAIANAALWTSGGRFVFQTNTGEKNHYIDLGPIISDQWTQWILYFKWEKENKGIIRLWKNGELMIDRNNIPTITRDGNYFKLGINKFGWGVEKSSTNRRVLFFDEFRMGDGSSGFEKVKPKN